MKRKGRGFSVSLPDGTEIPFAKFKQSPGEFRQFLPQLDEQMKGYAASSFEPLVVNVDDVKKSVGLC